jgi:hypothetical protein
MLNSSLRSSGRAARFGLVLALGSVFSLAFVAAPALRAADEPTAPAAVKTLPVKTSIKKSKKDTGSVFELKVKNESGEALSVSAQVLLSVAFHATNKARNLPAHTLKPGKSWHIKELSAEDKVILTAEGYAPLEVTIK